MREYRPLPVDAHRILTAVHATPRLVAHLTLVHDVACELVAAIQKAFPEIVFDADDVFFGAATHDIGKAEFPNELIRPGSSHEAKGAQLLIGLGVPAHRARFAITHGNWSRNCENKIEDLFVALADNVWKGKRSSDLETQVARSIVQMTWKEEWRVFVTLDDILEKLAADADHRLAWQAAFPVAP